jgi:hypothetical protein
MAVGKPIAASAGHCGKLRGLDILSRDLHRNLLPYSRGCSSFIYFQTAHWNYRRDVRFG